MKTVYRKYIFHAIAAFAYLMAACTPNMDSPDPGSKDDPTRPDAPPQVIFMPDGVEVTSLAVSGGYLYATSPNTNQVYRLRIEDETNLSRTANAVPYVTVPGANGIAADSKGGLFIGSSGAPKAGATAHKWDDDRVIYFTHTSESWHARFKNKPAQKLFEAPRGSFNALSVFKDAFGKEQLYYTASTDLEGMSIDLTTRGINSLGAVRNLLDNDMAFLVDLAFGKANFDNIELDDILRIANLVKLNLNLEGMIDHSGNIDIMTVAMNNLDKFAEISLNGSPITLTIQIPVKIELLGLLISFNIPIQVPLNSLSITPKWGLNLATLWGMPIELPRSDIDPYIEDLINDNVMISDIKTLLQTGVTKYLEDHEYGWAKDIVLAIITDSFIKENIKETNNLNLIINDYLVEEGGVQYISLNGNYKDQVGEFPPRPYVMGVPISLNFDEDRLMNTKLALTLALLQFQDNDGTPFTLIDGQPQFDAFVAALNNGDIFEIVKALELKRVIINNPRLAAYRDFLVDISESPDLSSTTLDKLYNLMSAFNITIDFRTLLEAWEQMPDWSDLPGTRAGTIAPHELLGDIYSQIDQFVEGAGRWQGLAGWVTSHIPRVNSAAAWWYGNASNNPTGIAFGQDVVAGGIAGWVVDQGILYSRRIDRGPLGGSYQIVRDDYPNSTENPEPQSPWVKGARNRWTLTVAGSGQSNTNLDGLSPQLLSNCFGAIYDAANQRVLVSCSDGPGSTHKGRIVSVKYKDWIESSGSYPIFNPPAPRLPVAASYLSTNVSYEIHEYIPADGELNFPKGMAVNGKFLYIADGNRIVVYYMGKTNNSPL